MKIETYIKGNFQIVRISESSSEIADLAELRDLIAGYCSRGICNIAVSFCDASYIYSGAIRVLIQCHKLITEHGGELCIIEPNPELFDALELLNIDRVIKIYVSEEYLPA